MDPLLTRLALVAGLVVLTAVLGRLWQRRDGRIDRTARSTDEVDRRPDLELDVTHAGPQAVLFGSPTCRPCDQVKRLLDDVAADRPDFTWTYVDAADRLDLADAHDVRRVPTLLVLDDRGSLVARSSGVPDGDELRTTVDAHAPAAA